MKLSLRSNDVALRANDVVPAAQMKKSKSFDLDFWQGQKDLNPRPMVLETSTLPTELYPCVSIFMTDILYHAFFAFAIPF